MKFTELSLKGAYLIDIERIKDNRGFFARTYCEQQFSDYGLETQYPQANVSYNHKALTIRGMHWQASPHQEVKLVRCVRGCIYDVIVDLRKDSPTYCSWYGVFLDESSYKMLYVPEDFAHGYLTWSDDAVVLYQVSEPYNKQYERGAKWDDLTFNIRWPEGPDVISERDKGYPPFIK